MAHPSAADMVKLIPRAYQEEIFTRAQLANVIATLDTGSGKTFIAALLIKWMSALPGNVGKKIVFLVPKVPLVDQQSEFLSKHTPLVTRGYKGAMNVDSWDISRWNKEFAQTDVLVMTAQILCNILTHAYWSLDKVSLLVFDECHHAMNNHPYNTIMRDHYSTCVLGRRPKIFGMTASPIWNLDKPLESLRKLQSNLFSVVLAVRDNVEDLSKHVHRPTEIVERYPSSPINYPGYCAPSLMERLLQLDSHVQEELGLTALLIRYSVALQAVGPYGADAFLHAQIKTAIKELRRSNQDTPKRKRKAKKSESPALTNALLHFEELLQDDFVAPTEWLSPKAQRLVDVLLRHRSAKFHGMVFVEQRHVASTLSWLLARLPETKDWLRCGIITGHGDSSSGGDGSTGMGLGAQQKVVKAFRDGELNLLIATAVAEEGLDFQACELVIRFDPVKHMVGYVQSRGRARNPTSSFVVMIDENDTLEHARYHNFKGSEPSLRKSYQTAIDTVLVDDDEMDRVDPFDLQQREVYRIPMTGATLTYSNAIDILSQLCALIPRDEYTEPHLPKYSGDFEATLELPSALPLEPDQYVYQGPLKRTKKEAKRAVAFRAVRQLHALGVIDDYLKPKRSISGEVLEDADGRPVPPVNDVPEFLEALVENPWKAGPPWFLHVVSLDGQICGGIVNGLSLTDMCLQTHGVSVQMKCFSEFPLVPDDTQSQIQLMSEFTKLGIWWCVSGSPMKAPPACFLVPVDEANLQPDWELMERAVSRSTGVYDWDGIDDAYAGKLLMMNRRKHGRPLLFNRLRGDLKLSDKPDLAVVGGEYETYSQYFESECPTPGRWGDFLLEPPEGPIIEAIPVPRVTSASYLLDHISVVAPATRVLPPILVPQSWCKWIYLTMDLVRCFHTLSALCQCITDVYRARAARTYLQLPPVPDVLLIEALTIPAAAAGFDNQRLETYGDTVLKTAVCVHLYNAFPTQHEGQMSTLKSICVSNRTLLARAREIGLERYISCEHRATRTWRYFLEQEVGENNTEGHGSVRRRYPRRSLQDCMEALLGAAYVTGSVEMALHMGTALRLCFGGSEVWCRRYRQPKAVPVAALFSSLQSALGYTFRNGRLLVEAVTHPSIKSAGGSAPNYQRLEFLGDAVIDQVVMDYIFPKFSKANSGQLSWAKSSAICNPVFAAVGVKKLSLHLHILSNNVRLNKDALAYIPTLQEVSYEEVVTNGWRYDPPKVLSDVFESVIGAMIVDSGFDMARTSEVVRKLMDEVLEVLRPDLPKDPVSNLLIWCMRAGCRRIRIDRERQSGRKETYTVVVHNVVVTGPVSSADTHGAKGVTAAQALAVLKDEESERSLKSLCDCIKVEASPLSTLERKDVDETEVSDNTEDGFALQGQILLGEQEHAVEAEVGIVEEEGEESDDVDIEEDEQHVEMMLGIASESEVSDMEIESD